MCAATRSLANGCDRCAGAPGQHRLLGEQRHQAQKIPSGRPVETQLRLELERPLERMAEMGRAMPLDQLAFEAHADLRVAGVPAHVQRQGRRDERSGLRRRTKAPVAAQDRGVAGDRDLHQKKIIEPVGIDLDVRAVFEPIERHRALAQMMHARLQIFAGVVQAQQMRLEDARDARSNGVEIARREHQGLVGKRRIHQLPTTQIHGHASEQPNRDAGSADQFIHADIGQRLTQSASGVKILHAYIFDTGIFRRPHGRAPRRCG